MAPAMPTSHRAALLASLVLIAAAAAVGAQDAAPPVGVRVVAIKATVVAAPEPLPEALRPWASKLEALPGTHRFELLGQSARRAAPGSPLAFSLPRDHEAQAVVAARPDGRLDLRVVITRPGKEPGTREQVLAHDVTLDDGGAYVVRVQDAFGAEQHLLLVVSAGTRV